MNLAQYARLNFKVRGRNDNMPRLAKTDRVGFAKALGDLGLNKGVEVGVREGIHSLILCQQNPNIELTCIDPWAPYGRWTALRQKRFFNKAVAKMKPHNAKFMKKTSMDALQHFEDESLDFAYIDGNHDFDHIAPDLVFWAQKVRKGGVVGAHDYFHFKLCGVVHAVDAYTRAHCINPWFVTYEPTPTAFWQKT